MSAQQIETMIEAGLTNGNTFAQQLDLVVLLLEAEAREGNV